MHRFFVDIENIKKDTIDVTGEDVNHISKVLRLRIGDSIVLCDGHGMDYYVSIEGMDKHEVRTRILSKEPSKTEPKINVVLYQGIPKSAKMDVIIQKCTELGISQIVPVINARSVVKLSDEKDERKKVERWQRIALEAAKQSQRGKVPKVEMPIAYEEALKNVAHLDLSVMPYELEKNNKLKNIIRGKIINSIGIFIGPEGGYEDEEIYSAVERDIVPVTLGPRILRTETAGSTVLSCVMYELDEM
ncbi:16S rRNA (uracil(1498)-N(3))-methyltransferase [Lutispora thermophila]|uniref:Ribosomal RNA small subunit methyltransferase E n=1 Tax=Lutispora thermophila DSM 19022 TaxID=1122184 RepID=A0A1M6DCL8_9FIRM|nr:16S rRNA (uracil(1498)-N(3))-methyltransferase [Lutispora thermophila]SHI70939.1 16S rRNA (uracil1498-N3)-methyltransferase [Lutispora thermophila DSM 19022]